MLLLIMHYTDNVLFVDKHVEGKCYAVTMDAPNQDTVLERY